MLVTTHFKTKLAKVREMQASAREGSATAQRMRQEEEELAAKHSTEMERINHKYGGALRCGKRKPRASPANLKLKKKAKTMEQALAKASHVSHPLQLSTHALPAHASVAAPSPLRTHPCPLSGGHLRLQHPQWGRS